MTTLEGKMIKVENRRGRLIMTMEVDPESMNEAREYVWWHCCQDYDEQIDFHYEFRENFVEFDVTNWTKEIEEKYFSKGNKMIRFPFQAKVEAFYNVPQICFCILEV